MHSHALLAACNEVRQLYCFRVCNAWVAEFPGSRGLVDLVFEFCVDVWICCEVVEDGGEGGGRGVASGEAASYHEFILVFAIDEASAELRVADCNHLQSSEYFSLHICEVEIVLITFVLVDVE
jgi:hypothetical protein